MLFEVRLDINLDSVVLWYVILPIDAINAFVTYFNGELHTRLAALSQLLEHMIFVVEYSLTLYPR